MLFIYPFIISFIIIFVSELGDKTQLIALSFASKLKTCTILLGVALGSLFSHGIAILFGSFLGNIENLVFQHTLKIITYISFLFFGIITLKSTSENSNFKNRNSNNLYNSLNYIFFIAFSIAVGELGDKTFLSSIGLGIQYPNSKIMLVLGAIFAMMASDLIAIVFGKVLTRKISENAIQNFSGILFLVFGFLGILNYIIK